MTTYTTQDGFSFKANRSRLVVKALRAESWIGRGISKEAWMRDVSRRNKLATGQRIRANNEVNFVHDLVKAGLLKKEIGNV